MDVSDPNDCIERPQDIWAGGPPDRAKMEAEGEPREPGRGGVSPAGSPNGLQLVGGYTPHPLPAPGTVQMPVCFV